MELPERPLLAFPASTRKDSWNNKLLRQAVEYAQRLQANVDVIDLRDFPLPIYDAELESHEGVPANARKLRELMERSAGFMIASPEYNGALSPLLKNILDWTSRPGPGEDEKTPFRGKPAALMSASPGGFGGFRGLMSLSSILNSLGMLVLPEYVIVGSAPQAFDAEGRLAQQRQRDALAQQVARQVALAATLPSVNRMTAQLAEQLRYPPKPAPAECKQS
jgi:chromate reductase